MPATLPEGSSDGGPRMRPHRNYHLLEMAEEESQQRTATKKEILQTKLTLILTEGGGAVVLFQSIPAWAA